MSLRSAQFVIQRLKGKGLITIHLESAVFASGHFYRFSHEPKARAVIARWLGVSPSELRSPSSFSKELNQPAQCAQWVVLLRDNFPRAQVSRDREVIRQRFFKTSKCIFLEPGHELVPDIVLSIEGENAEDQFSVGFEIERARRSDRRVAAKIKMLIHHSFLDGMVYVCESGGVADAICAVLNKREMLLASRIRHYPSAFILFTDRMAITKNPLPKLVNIEGKAISLEAWITALRRISAAKYCEANSGEP